MSFKLVIDTILVHVYIFLAGEKLILVWEAIELVKGFLF